MDPETAERIEDLREIVADEPDALGHFMLARELTKVDQFDEAVKHSKAALALDPDYTAAYRCLGRALTSLGFTSHARSTFEQGLEVAAKMGDLQTAKEMEVFLKRLDG